MQSETIKICIFIVTWNNISSLYGFRHGCWTPSVITLVLKCLFFPRCLQLIEIPSSRFHVIAVLGRCGTKTIITINHILILLEKCNIEDYFQTCKWLLTWQMVNPSTFICLSTPFGVATVWALKWDEQTRPSLLGNTWEKERYKNITFCATQFIHRFHKQLMKLQSPSESGLACSITFLGSRRSTLWGRYRSTILPLLKWALNLHI